MTDSRPSIDLGISSSNCPQCDSSAESRTRTTDDSSTDLKRTAEDWLAMAVYDFRMLGLDRDRPDLLGESSDPVAVAYCNVGREIVLRMTSGMSRSTSETLLDALVLQRVVFRFLPAEYLKPRAESLRKRFQALIGMENYAAYSSHTASEKPQSVEEIRAEMDFLLSETMYVYLVTPLRHKARGQLLWYCVRPFVLVTSLMTVVSSIVAFFDGRMDQYAMLAFIPIFGALGAMISLQQRVENLPNRGDSIRNVIALESGRETLWTTSIAGAVFAVIINLVFQAGMIKGNLFPSFEFLESVGSAAAGPNQLADIAKMLIWSFVSGFAERLVPDTITKLTHVLRSEDFGANNRPVANRTEEPESGAKPDFGGVSDDIYSKLLKAQSDLISMRDGQRSTLIATEELTELKIQESAKRTPESEASSKDRASHDGKSNESKGTSSEGR
jgi:hypothetical protein